MPGGDVEVSNWSAHKDVESEGKTHRRHVMKFSALYVIWTILPLPWNSVYPGVYVNSSVPSSRQLFTLYIHTVIKVSQTTSSIIFWHWGRLLSQVMASSATSVFLQKVGMTVLTSKRRRTVPRLPIAVANTRLKDQVVVCLLPCTPKVARLRPSVTRVKSLTCANHLTPQLMSSARSTAARVTCAMELKYQWSAPSCSLQALLQLSLVDFQHERISSISE